MKLLFISIFSLLSLSILGQQADERFLISGTVFDADTHTALQFITITLQDTNTKEIFGDITNKKGEFELFAPKGKYDCVVESLSFDSFIIQSLAINQDFEFGAIELKQKIEELDEIEIVAKDKLMDYQFSKKVYKASKDIANVGGNAVTVLENTPTVRVSEEGGITIRGNSARVLVDGKPFGGQKSNGDILSLIPANSIKSVEILKGGAKYDADGGGEIINIILNKGVNDGYNGTIEVHGGIPDNDGVSTFLSLKTDKLNMFATASFNHKVTLKDTEIEQTFFDDNKLAVGSFFEEREDYRQRNNTLFSIGSDFYLNEKSTVTASLLYTSKNNNYDSELFLNDYQPIDHLVKTSTRIVDDNSDESLLEAFINYTAAFNTEGHELAFNFNFNNYNSINDTYIDDTETFPSNNLTNQKYKKDEFVDNYYIEVNYTLPFKNNSKIEAGHKSSFRFYENHFATKNLNQITQVYELISGFNNKFNYDESIYAFYLSYSQKLERISYSIQLRTEITETEISDKIENNTFINNYTDLFPTVSLSYNFDNGNAITAFYNYSINRPLIWQLNPFNSFADERFIRTGNPFLKPYYTNYFVVEYNHEFEKINFNTAVFYTSSKDYFLNVLEKTDLQTADGFDIYRSLPKNNGTLSYLGIELGMTYNLSKKLRFYGTISPAYTDLTKTIDNKYDYNDVYWYGAGSLLYKINNTLRFQVNFEYQSPLKTAITELDEYYFTNLAINKDLFDNRATLTFKMNDVFHTRKAVYSSQEANAITNRTVLFQTRYLLSFTYRFNKARKRNPNNRAKDIDKNIFEIEEKIKQ